MKSDQKHFERGEPDPRRRLRLIGGAAAFLASLGIVILGLWFVLRAPRF